ncbi:hypothetical protein PR048_009465 [Dryococelus australis]|uniref:Uncharacterized protein n=1 Tax=Dryococelus australis TaxID=614101 RepID=A0ABQ9I116_9NEOP|nr:hypothetical protein PR048_009465 [Dryococelus australis]
MIVDVVAQTDIRFSVALSKHMNMGKKQSSNVLQWQCVPRKKVRDAGKEYTSKRTGAVPVLTPPQDVHGIISNTCSTCDAYYVKLCAADNEEDKQRILNETTIHHIKAALGYRQLQQDTEAAKLSPNLVVLCPDVQQVLFCPTLHHSCVFYQRQLSSYNFCIYGAGANTATMMFWHEAIGNFDPQKLHHDSSVMLKRTILLSGKAKSDN